MLIKPEQEALHDTINIISFSEAVEKAFAAKEFDSYIGAILHIADEMDLDEKQITKLISANLKEKLRIESEEEGLLFRSESPMFTFE